MGLAYLRHIQQDNYIELVEIIELSPGSPPPRPHPEPPVDPGYFPPGVGPGQPGGPVDPGYFPPGVGPGQPGGPNAPHPSHPIALPGDPWWGTGGPQPGEPPKGFVAIVAQVPPGATPPAAPPPDATVVFIKMGKDAMPTYAWVAPYATQLPGQGGGQPPTGGQPPAKPQ